MGLQQTQSFTHDINTTVSTWSDEETYPRINPPIIFNPISLALTFGIGLSIFPGHENYLLDISLSIYNIFINYFRLYIRTRLHVPQFLIDSKVLRQ